MMLRSGQRRVSPPPFLPERPLLLQGNQAASTQLPSEPTRSSSPLRQVTMKEEPQGDTQMPPLRLTSERFVPYTRHLPRISIKPTVIKQEAEITPASHSEPISRHPSQSLAQAASTAAVSHGVDNMQSVEKERAPYAWVNEYTSCYVCNLAGTIGPKNLPINDRKDLLKTLEAAKSTILELLTDEEKTEFDLDDVPEVYTEVRRVARQLDLMIPVWFIPANPGILPMDRMLRATQSFIDRLRAKQRRLQRVAVPAQLRTALDTHAAAVSEPSDQTLKENQSETLSEPRREKVTRKKVKGNNDKTWSSGEKLLEPEIQAKPKASKKRKDRSDYETEEELGTKFSRRGRTKQKLSSPPIEQEMPEPEVKEPKAKKKKKEKQAMIQYPTSEEDMPPVKKRKKDISQPSEHNTPEPATEHRKKKTKKSSGPGEEEPFEDLQPEPSSKKKKKKAKESTPVEETLSQNTPEAHFDADASFLGEALETIEGRNHDLTKENQDLKAILQAFGVNGVKLSVALTRMRHGQSAGEIFSNIKKEGS